MSNVTSPDLIRDLSEINLSYLLLGQRLLREDKTSGMSCLGLSEQAADMLVSLSNDELTRIARSNQLLCRLRLDDHTLLEMLADKGQVANTAATPLRRNLSAVR